MLLLSGFNGFGQCSNISGESNCGDFVIRSWLKVGEEGHLLDLSISWNSIMIITKDGEVKVYGFTNGRVKILKVEHPDKLHFIQGSCTRTGCTLVSDNGTCWHFNFVSGTWKSLTCLLLAVAVLPNQCHGDISIIKVSSSEIMTTVLSNKGAVYNFPNLLSPPEMVVKDIACGREHGVLLTEDGIVYTWGGGSRGQLGNGSLESSEELCEVELLAGLCVEKISAGGWHCCAVTKDGDLYTWGWNKQGQLGHPILGGSDKVRGISVQAEPIIVDWPSKIDVAVEEVSCGTSHTLIKLNDGSVWGCGWNKWGQLSNSTSTPVSCMTQLLVPEGFKVAKVICGAWNTLLISAD